MKVLFSQLDTETQLRRSVVPHYVSVTKNPDKESREQIIAMQEKFIRLAPKIRKKMGEEICAPIITKIGKDFQLTLFQMASISRTIRNYFFGEVEIENIPDILSSELGTGFETAKKITEIVKTEIIEKEVDLSDNGILIDPNTTVNLPLLQALSKYEQLGQQVITSEKIKLKTQIEPVRPSLINWLKYYRDELGIGQHSSVERGEFLFRSENCRKLSGEERERISLILKSVEEYLPIAIDAERQEIIFPSFAKASEDRPKFQGVATPAFPSVAPNSQEFGRQSLPTPARSNAGSVSFSSGHTLPAEKEESNSFRIRPMSGGR